MKGIWIIGIVLTLGGCAFPDNEFFIVGLSDTDAAMFRQAADFEGVNVIEWPAPWAWIVMYGPTDKWHANGTTIAAPNGGGTILLRDGMEPCDVIPHVPNEPRDWYEQRVYVTSRHEIGHTKGRQHSTNQNSVMHSPSPCSPTD